MHLNRAGRNGQTFSSAEPVTRDRIPAKDKPPSVEPGLFDAVGAGRYLALSEKTVMRLLRCGELRAIRIGRAVRFSRKVLDNFIAKKEAEAEGGDG